MNAISQGCFVVDAISQGGDAVDAISRGFRSECYKSGGVL